MLTRVFAAAAIVLIALAVLLLGPIHATGVRGTALHPRYVPFYVGFYSYAPTGPGSPKAALAQAGITAPDVAVHRRVDAAVVATGGAVVIGAVLVGRIRRAGKLEFPGRAAEASESP